MEYKEGFSNCVLGKRNDRKDKIEEILTFPEALNKIEDILRQSTFEGAEMEPLMGELADLLDDFPQNIEQILIGTESIPVLLNNIRFGNVNVELYTIRAIADILEFTGVFAEDIIAKTPCFIENLGNTFLSIPTFRLMHALTKYYSDYFDTLICGDDHFLSCLSSMILRSEKDFTVQYFHMLNITLKEASNEALNSVDSVEQKHFFEIAANILQHYISSCDSKILAEVTTGMSIIVERFDFNWNIMFSVNVTEKIIYIMENYRKVDRHGICRKAMVPMLDHFLKYKRVSDHPHHERIIHNIITLIGTKNNPDESYAELLSDISEYKKQYELIINDENFKDMFKKWETNPFKTNTELFFILSKLMVTDPARVELLEDFEGIFETLFDMLQEVDMIKRVQYIRGITSIIQFHPSCREIIDHDIFIETMDSIAEKDMGLRDLVDTLMEAVECESNSFDIDEDDTEESSD